jgi:hypothetical protein
VFDIKEQALRHRRSITTIGLSALRGFDLSTLVIQTKSQNSVTLRRR